MSTLFKYRIHEVAKDFGMTSKALTEMLRDFGTDAKNHMQVLTQDELNYLFERVTAERQVDNLEQALALQKKSAPAPKPAVSTPAAAVPAATGEAQKPVQAQAQKLSAPSEPAAKDAQPQTAAPDARNVQASGDKRSQPSMDDRNKAQANAKDTAQTRRTAVDNRFAARPGARPGDARPAQRNDRPAAQQAPAAQTPARPKGVTLPVRPAEKEGTEPVVVTDAAKTANRGRYVDTRGTSVNLARYDERIDSLVPDAVQNAGQSKQKLTKKRNDRKSFVSSKKRAEEAEKFRRMQRQIEQKKVQLKVLIPDEIAVGELALRLKKTAADVIKRLMKMGVMASVSQFIDFDTASLIAMEFGAKVEREIIMTIEDKLIDSSEDREENLVARDPVVVVMGHVDHGKTSLLDAFRRANVAAGEAGGITQHIGAYRVQLKDREITFLDTPGHEAFTSMRARGASVTDIVILVVAADDGIMPQTVEAINHAKNAGVPVVVAINKIDRPNAQPDRVLQQLSEHGLVPEDWGGETIVCQVSAKQGTGLENLLEMVLLTADMLELRANPERLATGTVVEAKLDRGRGPVATMLVQNGTLKTGDVIIAGKSVGRVRLMTDEHGRKLETAGPSVPVEIIGLSEVPGAGDRFHAVEDERMARELVEQRKTEEKDAQAQSMQRVSLDSLFDYIKEGEMKELGIIVKADVHGTSEAVKASLEKLSNEEVRVRVIHTGVGGINESDVMLASAANAIIVGFNVRPSQGATETAKLHGVDMRLYRVIYDCIEEMEAAMKGMLAPKFREVVLGHAEVRQIFKASGIGTIAGCYVQNGKIVRGASVRIVRDGIVVHEGEMASLKRFKDDAREVATGYECGISIERFNDIKEGDVIEAYTMEEIKP